MLAFIIIQVNFIIIFRKYSMNNYIFLLSLTILPSLIVIILSAKRPTISSHLAALVGFLPTYALVSYAI